MEVSNYLERIALNDIEAFNELYNLINNNVYSFALSILKNNEDALDVTQDVFITIYHNAFKYQNQNKPMAWILTITKNIAYNKIKSNKKTINVDEIEFISKPNHDDKILIEYLLNNLNDDERNIVILHAMNGFKFYEIAKILDLKITTTLSKYHRAIKKLKENHKFEKLPENLKEIATLRINNPNANLTELGKMLKEPVGKTGVNYRLKKIMEIADEK